MELNIKNNDDNDEINSKDNLDITKMFELHYKLLELFENSDKSILDIELQTENDNGFIEYKRNIASFEYKPSKLKTQIYWRLSEGLNYNSQSSCYYIIGIENNGQIKNPITQEEITKTINIINKCTISSDIKYIYKNIIYKNTPLLIVKFWKEEKLNETDIRIILLGASESYKTKFFVGLHNCKFNIGDDSIINKKINEKIFKSDIYDVHVDETKIKKTLILHHQYFNIEYNKDINSIDSTNLSEIHENLKISDSGKLNIHIIDTPGNSIISNIKYLISYNTDIIIHFNHNNNLYNNILEKINKKYNNVLNITDTTFLEDFDTKKILHLALLKYQYRNKIIDNIEDILLINEARLIQSYQNTQFNKYIFYCYNLMKLNTFDKISDVNIRNIQHKYDYKSIINTNNSISIETDKSVFKCILGETKMLESLDLFNNGYLQNESVITYYIIILNQIYIVNNKTIPNKILFDKIILIPKKYITIPIFIMWYKNDNYHIKIYDYKD